MKIVKVNDLISIKRSIESGTAEQLVVVKNIISDIRTRGDKALQEYTEKFDRVLLESFAVTEKEMEEAFEQMDSEFISIVREAAKNIRSFHEKQLRPSWMTTEENGSIL